MKEFSVFVEAMRRLYRDGEVDEKKIKSAGISGVMGPGKTSVQVIVGTKVQFVADEFKKLCK